ncbi:MAG: CapA family protein [Oligoflexia bacterium]|nr:CapA family protein [Oligoflexia bacterium]
MLHKNWNLKARAEERIHEMSLLDKISYVYKYVWGHQYKTTDPIASTLVKQNRLRRSEYHRALNTEDVTTLGLVGDIMWIRDSWKTFLQPEAKKLLEENHILVGNLETILSSKYPVKEYLPDRFVFNSPTEYLDSFQKENVSLFTSLSFANNHTLDYFDEGALDTLKNLDQRNIHHCGVEDSLQQLYTKFSQNNISFGHYSATFGMNDLNRQKNSKLRINYLSKISTAASLAELDLSEVLSAVSQMKKENIQFIMVSLHWGHEFEHFPKTLQRDVAKKIIQAGAHCILGCHPHVIQPYEFFSINGYDPTNMEDLSVENASPYKALVCYSLGNFSNAMITVPCQVALLLQIKFFKNARGELDWNGPITKLLWNQNEPKNRKMTLLDFHSLRLTEKKKKDLYNYLLFLGTHIYGQPNFFLEKS